MIGNFILQTWRNHRYFFRDTPIYNNIYQQIDPHYLSKCIKTNNRNDVINIYYSILI